MGNTEMGETVAIMFTFTTYGSWLRGDIRGWVDNGIIYPSNPDREHSDYFHQKAPAYFFPSDKLNYVGNLIGYAVNDKIKTKIYALTVTKWHAHFVTGPTNIELGKFVQIVKATVRSGLKEKQKIWTRKYDKRFCFSSDDAIARIQYVQQHNIESNLAVNPWDFIETF